MKQARAFGKTTSLSLNMKARREVPHDPEEEADYLARALLSG